MQTDIEDNGANLFELFNGVNGWHALKISPFPGPWNLGCSNTFLTLFNATPSNLMVQVTPQLEGLLFEPGGQSSSLFVFELPPYGYLPVVTFGGANVTISTNTPIPQEVGGFTMISTCDQSWTVSNVATSNNYWFAPLSFDGTAHQGNAQPNGIWATIINSTLQP